MSSGSESPFDNSLESDDEDNVNLSRLFKKEAKVEADSQDNDDGRETLSDSPVKGKPPNKSVKVKKTPEKKRKKAGSSERGSCLSSVPL